ncbi:uncharacterized protein LOC144114981 isoform X4 [Amblyomma americanum]
MDNPQSNESSAAESRPETNLDLPASSMEAPTSGSHGAVANQEHSLRNYEQNIISLRQENLRLRLRSFYLQLQTKTPAEENENEFKNVAEQIQKFVTELDERDKLLDESRTKREELEKLVANLIHEKAALEDELCKWKMKTNVSEAAQDDNVKMVSTLSHVKKELEDKVKQLEQQLDELKDKKVPSLKRQLDTRTAALQAISAHAAKQEEALKSLHNVHSLCSLIQPKTEAFLQLIDDSLAAGDIQATQRAKNDFQRELSKISSEHCSFQLDSTEQPCSVAAFSDRVWKLEAELQSRENLIECLNSDIACLTSRLEATQTRCLEYETEMKRASEIHQKICAEKDKLLDSVQRKMQEMERHAQEGLSPKSRTSELQLECNRLHIAVLEKSRFINELLSERNKATVETEKSFHELLLSMKQKDQLIEMMQTKFEHAEEGEAVIENEGLRQPNPADFLLETCEGQPKPAEPGTPLGTERPSFQGSSPASPEGPDEPTVFYLSQSVPREVKVLYQILSDLAQESGIMPELSTVALTNISCIQKVTEILKSAHEKGLRFSLPIQSTIVNMDSLDHCEPDERGLAAWEPTVLVKLGEKLQQLAYLFAVDGPVVSKWQMADVVQLLDTVLEKAKQEAANKLFLHRSPEDLPPVLFGKGGQPKEHEELTHSAMLSPHLRNERGHSDISDYQEELLQDLGSALKCVGDLHNEVKALPLTPTSNETRKSTGSTDELIFAVDSSGQLVPVPVDQAGHFEKDASSQTEEPCDNLESLKSELNNAKAQVKFLQKSLKDSFSVKVTESPTGPNAQPLIEIDQNLPVLGSLGSQSPRKSGLSANRRWRKQLTNQKMSEFGLSENVFELQEEIFFLVLRIEDLERQLKDNFEVVSKHKDESLSEQAGVAVVQALEEKNAALQEQLHQMQEVSTVLLCRLEELAAFLEQLLAYDETGSLGSVTLSADMVAKIRQLVADSKDFSLSFSQSFLGSDNNSALSDHLLKRGSFDRSMQSILSRSKGKNDSISVIDKPQSCKLDINTIPPCPEDIAFMEDELKTLRDRVQEQQSEISSLTRRLEEEGSERASPAAGGRCPSRRHPGTPASLCEGEDTDASWRYQDQVVLVQASDSDDILLLLNERGLPENVYLRSTWQKQALNAAESLPAVCSAVAAEEADADADYSSSSSPSLLRWKEARNSALENGAPQEPLVPIGRFQCWSSDSDIWSEPDRSVSEQRMGGVCRKEWNKQPRRSPKETRKAMAGGRQEQPGSDTGAKQAKDSWPEVAKGKRLSCPTDGGRSKRAVSASHTKAQKLEKLLRRIQHCNSRLEDTLTVHKELCQKLLRIPSGDGPKDASESQQPKDLTESLVPSMRKLQFRLEEMVINNEVLQEILTEHVASGKAVLTEPCTPGGAGANSKEGAAEELNQCKKELACKERREDILKRAMVHEQDAKVQLEKELADCQKELQSLHEAHCALEKQYKTAVQRNSDLALRDPQRRSSFEKSRLERARGSSFERPDGEEMKLRDENHTLTAELRQQAQEIARLGKEEALHKDEVSNLSQEKTVLSQKLQAVQHEHEVLLESSSNKISELVTKLGALSTQNKNQHEEIRNLREMGESISRENIKLKHDLDATSSELEGLRVENQDLRETLLALRKQESLLRKNLEKAVDEQQAAKKISDEYSQSNKLLRMEKDQLGAKISDLSSRLDALECEKQSLYEEKQRLILEVSAGEDEVERVNSKLQSCEEECNNLRTQKSEVEAELQACNNKLQEFEHLAEQLREELSATKGKLESMDTRCNHLEQELGASKEAHKQLLWKRDELQRTLEAVGREAQQSKSLARMSLDKKHVMAFMELQDKSRSLQNVVMELKLKLERAMYENKCLRLELRVNEQFQSGNSSGAVVGTPDSLRSFATAASNASPPRLSPHQVPVDSSQRTPPVVGQHSCSHSRSYHTSPDLGIDSDPTPEHDVYSTAVEPTYVEHWQHRMGPDWSISSVHSAPDAFGGSCLLCQQGKDSPASWKFKANATYGGEQLDHPSTQSPSKSGFPVISCSLSSPGVHLCAIVQLSDHELLKKRVDESICLIRRVEASVQQALDALADFASDCTEPPECNRLLQDAERGCQSIKMCLMDSFKLICSFTMAQMPEAKEEHSFEHKQLRMELNKLQEKHSQQSAELQNALDQISSLKEKKEGMERAISRQLNKTKMVLKQTKGNLNVLRARDAKPEKK